MKHLFLLFLFYLAFPQTAYPYLDPGTGSYILQMLIAAFLGVFFAVKIYWRQTKTFLANLLAKRERPKTHGPNADTD